MSKFNPIRCLESSIPVEISDGALYVTTDTEQLFVDIDSKRLSIRDVITVEDEASLPLAPVKGKLYVALSEKSLWTFTTEWVQIGSGSGGGGYVLPVASKDILGGVKIDDVTIKIDENGVISGIDTYNKVETDKLLDAKQDIFNTTGALSFKIVSNENVVGYTESEAALSANNNTHFEGVTGSNQYIGVIQDTNSTKLDSSISIPIGKPNNIIKIPYTDSRFISFGYYDGDGIYIPVASNIEISDGYKRMQFIAESDYTGLQIDPYSTQYYIKRKFGNVTSCTFGSDKGVVNSIPSYDSSMPGYIEKLGKCLYFQFGINSSTNMLDTIQIWSVSNTGGVALTADTRIGSDNLRMQLAKITHVVIGGKYANNSKSYNKADFGVYDFDNRITWTLDGLVNALEGKENILDLFATSTTQSLVLNISDNLQITNNTLDTSNNVTIQGNTFNSANQLVQLDETGKLPAIDGSQLTNLPTANTYTKDEINTLLSDKQNVLTPHAPLSIFTTKIPSISGFNFVDNELYLIDDNDGHIMANTDGSNGVLKMGCGDTNHVDAIVNDNTWTGYIDIPYTMGQVATFPVRADAYISGYSFRNFLLGKYDDNGKFIPLAITSRYFGDGSATVLTIDGNSPIKSQYGSGDYSNSVDYTITNKIYGLSETKYSNESRQGYTLFQIKEDGENIRITMPTSDSYTEISSATVADSNVIPILKQVNVIRLFGWINNLGSSTNPYDKNVLGVYDFNDFITTQSSLDLGINLLDMTSDKSSSNLQLDIDDTLRINENSQLSVNTDNFATKTELSDKQNKLTAGEGITIKSVYPDAVTNEYLGYNLETQAFDVPVDNPSNVTIPLNKLAYYEVLRNLDTTRAFTIEFNVPFIQNGYFVGLGLRSDSPTISSSDAYLLEYFVGYRSSSSTKKINIAICRNRDNRRHAVDISFIDIPEKIYFKLIRPDSSTNVLQLSYKLNVTDDWTTLSDYADNYQEFINKVSCNMGIGINSTSVDAQQFDLTTVNFQYTPARDPYLEISASSTALPDNVITSDNISQNEYIKQLEARITALETALDGGNAQTNGVVAYQNTTFYANSAIVTTGLVGQDNVTIQDGEV